MSFSEFRKIHDSLLHFEFMLSLLYQDWKSINLKQSVLKNWSRGVANHELPEFIKAANYACENKGMSWRVALNKSPTNIHDRVIFVDLNAWLQGVGKSPLPEETSQSGDRSSLETASPYASNKVPHQTRCNLQTSRYSPETSADEAEYAEIERGWKA
jgi:hypothetical protein